MPAMIEATRQRWLDAHKVEDFIGKQGVTQVVAPPVPGVWLSTKALERSAPSKWDTRFLDLAGHVAGWSRDESTRVGAVIVDTKKRVISLGFNGFPAGVDDTVTSRDQKLRRTVHAEINALSFASRSVEGCTIYVTHPPCSNCAAVLIQHGLADVVFPKPSAEFLERWGESYEEGRAMFKEANVKVREI